jgi:hypothetical protein
MSVAAVHDVVAEAQLGIERADEPVVTRPE